MPPQPSFLEQAHDELSSLYAASEQLSLELNRESLVLEEKRDAISASELERQQAQADQTVLQASIDNNKTNIDRVRQELDRSGEPQRRHCRADRGPAGAHRGDRRPAGADRRKAPRSARREQKADGVERRDGGKAQLSLRANHALLTSGGSRTAGGDQLHPDGTFGHPRTEAGAGSGSCIRAGAPGGCGEAGGAVRKKLLPRRRENVTAANNMIAGYSLRLKARTEKRDGLKKQVSDTEIQLGTADSKLRMLREMERDFEGFSKAVKLVMQESARGALRGVHGPVSALIHADDEFTTAIETALGAAMQNIVVDTDNDKAAIQFLKRRDGGRATFLPLAPSPASGWRTMSSARSAALSASRRRWSREAKYESIVENLLGGRSLPRRWTTRYGWREPPAPRRIVTLDGQVMNRGRQHDRRLCLPQRGRALPRERPGEMPGEKRRARSNRCKNAFEAYGGRRKAPRKRNMS